ncbi:DUF421 domain-containing protein [Nesterenkonia pannonica]|uniref:DUF421 domain-containing protein n=1 Tax=Nesterenkonia pannonica TaxID=1548602 RepID=UPI0021643EB5|nr:YetF domain-containing protein [Nesterenkonia pannonica]
MWFDSWSDILRTLLVGTAAYVTLIAVLRLTGKRTLAQLNAFDFVVTVALGSTLATILLNADVSWLEGATALALLAGLQYAMALMSRRRPIVKKVITADPDVLLLHGRVDHEALRRHRMTESEIRHAARQAGTGDLSRIAAIVLETNGALSVISEQEWGDASALKGTNLSPRATSGPE